MKGKHLLIGLMATIYVVTLVFLCYLCDMVSLLFRSGLSNQATALCYAGSHLVGLLLLLLGVLFVIWLKYCR
jgi:hypothetical protein